MLASLSLGIRSPIWRCRCHTLSGNGLPEGECPPGAYAAGELDGDDAEPVEEVAAEHAGVNRS